MADLTLEHIDPRNGELVCGLCNEFNEIFADFSYNARKTNRFVPYRVCDYPAPTTFGDIGEFLIEEEWVICEFGGTEWWAESNRVGNATTKGIEKTVSHPNTIAAKKKRGKEAARIMREHPNHIPGCIKGGKANVGVMNSHPNTKQNRISLGRNLGSTRWASTVDGFESTAAGVAKHNRSIGADPTAKVRI